MAVCINKNSIEYQSLKLRAGISEFILEAVCRDFMEKYNRFPHLDELPNSNSELSLRDSLHVKENGGASISDILEVTGKETIEEAVITINNQHRDLETRILPIVDNAIVDIVHRPSEYNVDDSLEYLEYGEYEEQNEYLDLAEDANVSVATIEDAIEVNRNIALEDMYNRAIKKPLNKELSSKLHKILEKYHFEIIEGDLNETFGEDTLGAVDFLQKIVYLANEGDRNAITDVEEFSHAFLKLMGTKYRRYKKTREKHPENQLYSELRDLIETTTIYRNTFEEYKDVYVNRYHYPNLPKIKEEALGKALAAVIYNRYETKTKEDTTFFSKLSKWFNSVLGWFKGIFNKETKLINELNKIADSIFDDSYSLKYLRDSGLEGLLELNFKDTIRKQTEKDGGKALSIMEVLRDHGLVVSGSLSFRDLGTLYRKNEDSLHDLDYTVPYSVHKIFFDAHENYYSESKKNWLENKVRNSEFMTNLLADIPGSELTAIYKTGESIVVNIVISDDPNIREKFKQAKGSYSDRLETLTEKERNSIYLLDVFLRQYNVETYDKEEFGQALHFKEILQAKFEMGRTKDIFDYLHFNPKNRVYGSKDIYTLFQRISNNRSSNLTEEETILARAPRNSDGQLLAPNGKVSNLTESLYALVRTKAFKNWFGDWEKGLTVVQDNESYYRGQYEEPTIDKDGNLILKGKKDSLYNRAGYNIERGVSATTNMVSANEYGSNQHYAYEADVENKYGELDNSWEKENELEAIAEHGYYLIQFPKNTPNNVIQEAGEVKLIGDVIIPKGSYVIEHITDGGTKTIATANNKASKVVDENGEPLVVYHSSIENFTTFKPNKHNAIYFSSDYNYVTQLKPGNNYSVFLNIKNPFDTTTKEYKFETFDEKLNHDSVYNIINFRIKNEDGIIGNDNPSGNLISNGVEYVVFNPNQIKSATSNIGRFSKINDNIYDEVPNSYLVIHNALEKLANLYGITFNEVTDAELNSDLWEGKIADASSVNAFVYNGQIYINTDRADIDAPIHEMFHILVGSMRFENPELYKQLIDSVESLYNYLALIEQYLGRSRNDVNEEIFITELAKYFSGLPSLLINLDLKAMHELSYNIKRTLDTILMGSDSVKTISDDRLYNMTLKDVIQEVSSTIATSKFKGFINVEGSELHRTLNNIKSDLLKDGTLKEQCD